MAIVDAVGTQAALIAAKGQASRPNQGGSPMTFSDTVTFAAADAGSVGTVCGTLPAGLMITNIQLAFADVSADGATVDVGDSADANRYIDGVDVATGAGSFNSGLILAGQNYVVGTASGDNQILITTADGACAGAIKIVITGSM